MINSFIIIYYNNFSNVIHFMSLYCIFWVIGYVCFLFSTLVCMPLPFNFKIYISVIVICTSSIPGASKNLTKDSGAKVRISVGHAVNFHLVP